MHRTDKRAVAALVFAVLVYPEEAWGGCTFDNWCAEIYSKWANPDPSQPDTGIQLCAEIENQTTNDEYNGEATFNIDFEVEVPGLNPVVTVRQSFGRWETLILCVAYTTGDPGIYTTTVRVETINVGRNVEVESFTFTVEEDPCEGIVCNDHCEGNDRIWDQWCDDGDCVGGELTDCDDMDISYARATWCSGSELWSSIPGINYSCGGGQCNGACTESDRRRDSRCGSGSWGNWSYSCDGNDRIGERVYTNRGCEIVDAGDQCSEGGRAGCYERETDREESSQSCAFGCRNGQCNPDPCAGVNCNDYCDGNTRVWSRSCNNGQCSVGQRVDCNTMDVTGQPVFYCSGNERRRHQWMNDFSCVNGSCDPQGRWVNDALVENCAFGCNQQTNACNPGDLTCVRTECRNDDRWCVDQNGNYSRRAQDCGDDEVGVCQNHRCDNNGDVVCDRTDVEHFCLEDRCRQQSVGQTVVADDCNFALEVCQNGECLNRCLLGCFDQCNGDELVVRACVNNVCQVLDRADCNGFDSQGPVERYCSGDAVHERQQVTDGYCGGVLNACQTSVSTEDLGEFDACANYCDGSVAVSSRGCQDGVCGDGERVDCSTRIIVDPPVRYCLGDELRQHRRFVHNTCGGGNCNASLEQWVNDLGIQNCAWGCNPDAGQCNPDPCANVRCEPDHCDHDVVVSGGRCVSRQVAGRWIGECAYNREDCNERDVVRDERINACNAEQTRVISYRPMDDWFCAQGGGVAACAGRTLMADVQQGERCDDRCDGSASVWGRTCQDDACTAGNRSDCDAMDTEPVMNTFCDGDQVRAFDRWNDFSCDPARGRCDAGRVRDGAARPAEDCAEREPILRTLDRYCSDGTPTELIEESLWGCTDGACAIADVGQYERRYARCPGGQCEHGECNQCTIEELAWSSDTVVDHADVSMFVFHGPACEGVDAEWRVYEDDLLRGDCGFGIAPDERVGDGEVVLAAENLTTIPWHASYQSDIWGRPEYYFCLFPNNGLDYYQSGNLEVRPQEELLGDLNGLLVQNPLEIGICADYGDEEFSGRCVQELQTLSEQASEITDMALTAVVTAWEQYGQGVEVWLIYACEACAGGGVGVIRVAWTVCGAAVAAIPDPTDLAVCAPAAVMSLGCGVVCGGVVGDAVGFVVRRVSGIWHYVAESAVRQRVAHWTARGWRYLADRTRISPQGVRVVFQNEETLQYLDEYLTPNIEGGVPTVRYTPMYNVMRNYVGGKGFYAAVRTFRDEEGVRLLHTADFSLEIQNLRMSGYELTASYFLDGAFTRAARESIEQLSRGRAHGRFRLADVTPEIRLVPVVREGGQLRPGVLGSTDTGTKTIQLAVEETAEFFGSVSATQMLELVFKHELSHAVTNQLVRELRTFSDEGVTYTLNSVVGGNDGMIVGAVEYINDKFALRYLEGENLVNYTRLLREDIVRRLEHRPQEWDRWVTSWSAGGLEPTQGKFMLLRIYNWARDFNLPEAQQIREEVWTSLDGYAREWGDEARQRLMADFDSLADGLRADAATFTEDVVMLAASEDLHIVLGRYRYVVPAQRGGGAVPNVAADAGVPIDPRELAERDAGIDVVDPRRLAERDAGGVVTNGDVLTIGGQDAVGDAPDSGLCLGHPKLRGYTFDSVEQCLGEFKGDPREQYCYQLKPTTCWLVRDGGCDCSVGSRPSFDSSFLLLAFVAFLTRPAR